MEKALSALSAFEIEIAPLPDSEGYNRVLELAREEGLAVYDAAYLQHALLNATELATRDAALISAAVRRGVTVWDLRS